MMYLLIREEKPVVYEDTPLLNPGTAMLWAQQNLAAIANADQEFFFIIPMDVRKCPTKPMLICLGGSDSAQVDVRVVYRRLLEICAHAFICVHNHPSGSLQPSEADLKLTQMLSDGAKLLDLVLLDHFIIGTEGMLSIGVNH